MDFSLMYFLNLAIRRLWALLLAAVLFATGAFCYCKFLATPQYTATASVLVTNGGIIVQESINGTESVNTTDITASIHLVDTVIDILKTSDIYKQLAEDINNKYSYAALRGRASISEKSTSSMFVDVSFKASNPEEATILVNKFVALAPEYITKFVPYSNVAIAATADSASLVFPRTTTVCMLAALVGIAVAFIIVLLIDSFDQAILGEKDFTSHYDIPLIGSVPDFESMGVVSSSNYNYQKGGYNNGYQAL